MSPLISRPQAAGFPRRPAAAASALPPGFPLGRIFGVEITLDFSWLFIFTLITLSLYGGLRGDFPGRPTSAYVLGAVSASLAFFASILLHELAHSVVARARGMEVHGITLFFFGGVSRLRSEPRKPSDEFLMAIAGPLTSAALGVLFLAVYRLVPSDSLGMELVGWLGSINLTLAAFNLLPGFPLDGGRVFRSIAWSLTGNLRRATRIAGRAGSGVAYAILFFGFLQAFVFHRVMNGLWFGFLGWFLLSAAQRSVAQMELSGVLGRLRVGDVMRKDCTRVPPEESVARFVEERLLRTGERCFFVAEEHGPLLGLLTLQEIKSLPRDSWAVVPVRDVLLPPGRIRSVSPSMTLLDALPKMDELGVDQLPVLENDILRGVITRDAILRRISTQLELEPQLDA